MAGTQRAHGGCYSSAQWRALAASLTEVLLDGDKAAAAAAAAGAVSISVRDVSYTFVKGERRLPILHSISGTCSSIRVLAIMGSSGAGTTTLAGLLPGYFRGCGHPSAGRPALGACASPVLRGLQLRKPQQHPCALG